MVRGRKVLSCSGGGFLAYRPRTQFSDFSRPAGSPADSSSGRDCAVGRTERDSRSEIRCARRADTGQGHGALCLGKHHDPPEPVPDFISLTLAGHRNGADGTVQVVAPPVRGKRPVGRSESSNETKTAVLPCGVSPTIAPARKNSFRQLKLLVTNLGRFRHFTL
jgi:hypothetical protein